VGNQWAVLARLMPGRSPNAIKNRFHATKRKIERHNRRDGSLLAPGEVAAAAAAGAGGRGGRAAGAKVVGPGKCFPPRRTPHSVPVLTNHQYMMYQCSPRHPPLVRPSFIEFNGNT